MTTADMLEVVRTLQLFSPPEKLDLLIREHTADRTGRCPRCRTMGGCTLYTAARSARYARSRKRVLPVDPARAWSAA